MTKLPRKRKALPFSNEFEGGIARENDNLKGLIEDMLCLVTAWANYASDYSPDGEFHPAHRDLIDRAKKVLES